MIEVSLEDAQKLIDRKTKLIKLQDNAIFKKIFVEGYFKDEAARIAQAITNPEMMDDIEQRELLSQLKAIGHMQNYMLTIRQAGTTMELALKEEEERKIQEELNANKVKEVDPITGEEFEVEA